MLRPPHQIPAHRLRLRDAPRDPHCDVHRDDQVPIPEVLPDDVGLHGPRQPHAATGGAARAHSGQPRQRHSDERLQVIVAVLEQSRGRGRRRNVDGSQRRGRRSQYAARARARQTQRHDREYRRERSAGARPVERRRWGGRSLASRPRGQDPLAVTVLAAGVQGSAVAAALGGGGRAGACTPGAAARSAAGGLGTGRAAGAAVRCTAAAGAAAAAAGPAPHRAQESRIQRAARRGDRPRATLPRRDGPGVDERLHARRWVRRRVLQQRGRERRKWALRGAAGALKARCVQRWGGVFGDTGAGAGRLSVGRCGRARDGPDGSMHIQRVLGCGVIPSGGPARHGGCATAGGGARKAEDCGDQDTRREQKGECGGERCRRAEGHEEQCSAREKAHDSHKEEREVAGGRERAVRCEPHEPGVQQHRASGGRVPPPGAGGLGHGLAGGGAQHRNGGQQQPGAVEGPANQGDPDGDREKGGAGGGGGARRNELIAHEELRQMVRGTEDLRKADVQCSTDHVRHTEARGVQGAPPPSRGYNGPTAHTEAPQVVVGEEGGKPCACGGGGVWRWGGRVVGVCVLVWTGHGGC